MSRYNLYLALCFLALSRCQAQLPIPPGGYDGFLFTGSHSSEIQLEVFFDLMCPVCKVAWPTLKQVMNYYGEEQLAVTMHTFPLPYHHNAFFAAQGAQYLGQNNTRGEVNRIVQQYTELIFQNQEMFDDASTDMLSAAEVKSMFGSLVQQNMGVPSAPFVDALSHGAPADQATRTSWKFACGGRSVSGTPSYMVNGVTVAAESTWTLQQWQSLLNPLLNDQRIGGNGPKNEESAYERTGCPPNTTECEYLPGKIDCCTSGDFCVPNVGCRC
mmetsp:Transcript_608/g.2216  ORF Transcript_608/g.2216 Transcript_608/m.2216 type:complete len:271 (-) Transcript_608:160-972(-)